MNEISAQLSEYISHIQYEDLTPDAIASACRSTLDTLAAMVAGSTAPGIDTVVELAKGWGGAEEAHLISYGYKLPAPAAAWCNGSMARALEIDDCVDFLPVHPSASAVPALLALSEWQGGLSGRDFVTALALGQDVIIRLGLAVRQNAMESGRNNLFKIFGPTAAIARAMGLNKTQTQNALGISFSHAVGDGQCALDGALTLRLQQGIVAQGALLSGILAARGFSGAKDFLMGRYGYLVAYEPDPRLEYLTENLGQTFWGERITIKPFSACRCTHPAIDLVLSLSKVHNLDFQTVRQIRVRTTPEAHQLVAHPHEKRIQPDSAPAAQFSIQYTAAAAFVRGDVFLKELEPNALQDVKILDLARRVKVEPDASLRTEAVLGRMMMEIETQDGRTIAGDIEFPLGSPERPISYQACADKLMKCAAYSIRSLDENRLAQLIEQIRHLEDMKDVSKLLTYLV
jgi:2-methylcitrate dehydratase PrpD